MCYRDTTMETIIDKNPQSVRKRKRRRTQEGKRMHWSVLAFFVIVTSIILCKTFALVNEVWTNQLP